MGKKRRKERKKRIKKIESQLTFKDHLLYIILYIILFFLSFPLPLIVFVRDKLYLDSSTQTLAISTGYGVLWMILSMAVVIITTAYFGACEKKKTQFQLAIKNLLVDKRRKIFSIILLLIFIISITLSVMSSRWELQYDKIVKYNLFGVPVQTYDTKDVERVELTFGSAYISNGRYGSTHISFSYEVIVNENKISFDRYSLENLPLIDQIFIAKPHSITNEYYLEEWLNSLDCTPDLRLDISNIFD